MRTYDWLSFPIYPYSSLDAASSTPREGVDGGEDGIPMFKTASGKSVAVSRSSLRRAETVLDGLDGSRGELDCCVILSLITFILLMLGE